MSSAPLRILVAEDNAVNSMLLADFLGAQGHEVEVVADGEAAVASVRAARPDIVLMDIQMPTMDGLEATLEIRADPEVASVPIVALTALAMEGDAERCLAAGCDAYLSKPIDFPQLLAVLEETLR